MQSIPHTTLITVDASLKVESLLLAELQHQRDDLAQLTSEISGTFNFYLIAAGIIAVGIGTIQTVYYQLYNTKYVYTLTGVIDVLTIGVLVLGYLLSVVFLLRFLQLAKREIRTNAAVDQLRAFYIACLKPQVPTIEAAFSQLSDTKYFSRVPSYILSTVSLVGSLGLGGACFIALSYVLFNLHLEIFLSVLIVIISSCLLFGFCYWYKEGSIKKFTRPRSIPS